jgi:hypothetical protein
VPGSSIPADQSRGWYPRGYPGARRPGVHTGIALFKVATHDAAIEAMDGGLSQTEHGRLVAESLGLVTYVCSAGDVLCASWT